MANYSFTLKPDSCQIVVLPRMKKLFLVRHSYAEKYSETDLDIDRKLTAEGMKIASLLGKYLEEEGVSPDAIISSNAQRAMLTSEIVAGQLQFPLENLQIEDGLYEASIREFVDFLYQLDDNYQTVIIVGHNPVISYAADFLCDAAFNGMVPGAVVQINFELNSWKSMDKGLGKLMYYYDILSDN